MKMKNKISITLILLIGLIGAGFFVTQIGNEVAYIHIDYVVDVTDDRALVGIADNVFIGKVIAQTGNKPNTPPPEAGDIPGFSPQTQFSVEVLENIKGNLNGTITVSQYGGYERIIVMNQLVLGEGDKLLEPDKTYLFATGYNDIDGWHTITASNYGNLPIANKTDYQNKQERFKTAFAQEISLKEWGQKTIEESEA